MNESLNVKCKTVKKFIRNFGYFKFKITQELVLFFKII